MWYKALCNLSRSQSSFQTLRATRRRQRKTDPLASPAAVRSINEKLRAARPALIPGDEKELVRLLRAARHAQRYPATETKRGRPGRWKREDLLQVAAHLGEILDRETSAQTSLASFVDHYLRLPDFPADVIEVLGGGAVNLFEAEQGWASPRRASLASGRGRACSCSWHSPCAC